MAQVITFEDFQPAPRYDGNPWTEVQIEEGPTADGAWSVIDIQSLSPLDLDPRFPAVRSFTTEQADDAAGLWYRLVFYDATGDDALATVPLQNVPERAPYATVTELALLLRVDANERAAALRRVLQAATYEIDKEVGPVDIEGATVPYAVPPPLAVQVCLERAVEHWQQQQSPFGLIGIGAEGGPSHTARDSWARHAFKLAPLKASYGIG